MVPFTPGGGIDGLGRIVGQRLSEKWGQQVVVENKPGAGGNIASEYVARSAPDGYTMYITAAGLAVNQYLFPRSTTTRSPTSRRSRCSAYFPNLLVVPNTSPFNSVGDLLAEARKNPARSTFASPGHGSSPHMSGELFKYIAKVELTHVPYRGASPAFTDVIAGRVDCTFAVIASGLPLVQGGQLRALGVTSAERVTGAGCPGDRRHGVPGYDISSWFAFFVPAKTPPEIVQKMSADTAAVLAEPAVRRQARPAGAHSGRLDAGGARRASQGRDGKMGARHQGRQHQGQRVAHARPPPRHCARRSSGARRALPAPAILPPRGRTDPDLAEPFRAAGRAVPAGRRHRRHRPRRCRSSSPEIWGQQMVVENRGGGATNIGTEAVVRADPDGYTLLLAVDAACGQPLPVSARSPTIRSPISRR